jgi:hypothetical protein
MVEILARLFSIYLEPRYRLQGGDFTTFQVKVLFSVTLTYVGII